MSGNCGSHHSNEGWFSEWIAESSDTEMVDVQVQDEDHARSNDNGFPQYSELGGYDPASRHAKNSSFGSCEWEPGLHGKEGILPSNETLRNSNFQYERSFPLFDPRKLDSNCQACSLFAEIFEQMLHPSQRDDGGRMIRLDKTHATIILETFFEATKTAPGREVLFGNFRPFREEDLQWHISCWIPVLSSIHPNGELTSLRQAFHNIVPMLCQEVEPNCPDPSLHKPPKRVKREHRNRLDFRHQLAQVQDRFLHKLKNIFVASLVSLAFVADRKIEDLIGGNFRRKRVNSNFRRLMENEEEYVFMGNICKSKGRNVEREVNMFLNVKDGRFIAGKIFHVSQDQHHEKVQHEIAVLRSLKGSDHCSRIISVKQEPGKIILFQELLGSDLMRLLKLKNSFQSSSEEESIGLALPRRVCQKVFLDVLLGLDCLHEKGLVHRDIRPENVLYDHVRGLFKLIDFELTCFDGNLSNPSGTPIYMSPEIASCRRHNQMTCNKFQTDIWSFGCLVIKMTSERNPWFEELDDITKRFHPDFELLLGSSLNKAKDDIHNRMLEKISSSERGPPFPRGPEFLEFETFIQGCFNMRPEDRPSAATLLERELFRS